LSRPAFHGRSTAGSGGAHAVVGSLRRKEPARGTPLVPKFCARYGFPVMHRITPERARLKRDNGANSIRWTILAPRSGTSR